MPPSGFDRRDWRATLSIGAGFVGLALVAGVTLGEGPAAALFRLGSALFVLILMAILENRRRAGPRGRLTSGGHVVALAIQAALLAFLIAALLIAVWTLFLRYAV